MVGSVHLYSICFMGTNSETEEMHFTERHLGTNSAHDWFLATLLEEWIWTGACWSLTWFPQWPADQTIFIAVTKRALDKFCRSRDPHMAKQLLTPVHELVSWLIWLQLKRIFLQEQSSLYRSIIVCFKITDNILQHVWLLCSIVCYFVCCLSLKYSVDRLNYLNLFAGSTKDVAADIAALFYFV